MARILRASSGLRSRGARPNRSWSFSQSTAYVAVAAATKVLIGSFTLSNDSIDETVLRLVGGISVKSDQVAASEAQIGAWGMIPVTDLAAAAGAASIPGPVTDGGDDGWFVHQSFAYFYQVTGGLTADANQAHWMPVDSRAKRIVGEGTSLAIMVENAHATQAFDVAISTRLLSMVRGTR